MYKNAPFLLDSKVQNCRFESHFWERVLRGSNWLDSDSVRIRLLRFVFDSDSTFLDSTQL